MFLNHAVGVLEVLQFE